MARRLLRALRAAACIDDAAAIPDAVRWAAADQRDTATRRFGATLRTYRDLDSAFTATARRDAMVVAVLGTGVLRDRVLEALDAAGLRVGSAADATLAVLADSHHPDVPAHFDHPLQDRPHLHAGLFGERATAGPLVVPGTTSCLRCAHLHRRDADRAWPLLAVQWAQTAPALATPPIDPLLARACGDHVALLARAWADAPEHPALWADRAIELHLPDGVGRWVPRPAHPLCGCRWPAG